jgi:hypothetical protein
MANTILKSTAGSNNKLSLQSGAGNAALDVLDGGNIEIGNTITAGTLGSNVSVANCIIKKWHHFTYSTRAVMQDAAGIHFNWTTGFVPLDPVNNSLWVVGIIPTKGDTNDSYGFGLRFTRSGPNNTDFMNKGTMTHDPYHHAQSYMAYAFNVPAGSLAAATYTISHYAETTHSNHELTCPNTTDHSRNNPQATGELMIREYKNP